MNICSLQRENIEKFGEFVALIYEGEEEYTNVQLKKMSDRIAGALKHMGVKMGDYVVVVLQNMPETLATYPAILKLGAVLVPTMFLLQPEELERITRRSDAKYVITSKDLVWKIREVKVEIKGCLIVDSDESDPPFFGFKELEKKVEPVEGYVDVPDDHPSVLLFTSGTTGEPKGVLLTHGNILFNAEAMRKIAEESGRIEEIYQGYTGLAVLPLAHIYGLVLVFVGMIGKGRAVMLKWFDTKKVLKFIEKFKVRRTAMVPTMLMMLYHDPDAEKYDLSSMEDWGCAAAPLPYEFKKKFEEKFPGQILQGYGLTEAAPLVAIERTNRPRKPGSCGIPIPGIEVKIFDDEDRPLPPKQIGEIVVKGPNVMKEYYKMSGETTKALRGGWLHTGDMGYIDEDGYIFIVDRKKDLIIRGGFNIIPADVEEVLLKHPDVVEAAVIGIPDNVYGEEVKAFVVLKPGSKATPEEIKDFAKKYLAAHKYPRIIEIKSYLPKNPLGKVLRKVLREEELGRRKA